MRKRAMVRWLVAGAADTGNRDITIPAATKLSFKLTEPLTISPRQARRYSQGVPAAGPYRLLPDHSLLQPAPRTKPTMRGHSIRVFWVRDYALRQTATPSPKGMMAEKSSLEE
jgi:hypothetical protein